MKTPPAWLVLPAILFSSATLRAEEKPLTKADIARNQELGAALLSSMS